MPVSISKNFLNLAFRMTIFFLLEAKNVSPLSQHFSVIKLVTRYYIFIYGNKLHNGKAKVKHSLHKPITGPKGSRMLRLPDFEIIGT